MVSAGRFASSFALFNAGVKFINEWGATRMRWKMLGVFIFGLAVVGGLYFSSYGEQTATAAQAVNGEKSLFITEIMYDSISTDAEYVEISNMGDTAVGAGFPTDRFETIFWFRTSRTRALSCLRPLWAWVGTPRTRRKTRLPRSTVCWKPMRAKFCCLCRKRRTAN